MAKPGEPPEPGTTERLFDPSARPDRESVDALAETLPSLAPGAALPPGTTVDRYVIETSIGEGGMGVVYLAHDPQLDRKVALKLLHPEDREAPGDSEGRHRLVREAHSMAKLNHPNVVAIYDAGIHDGRVFLAVEVVEGQDMRRWLKTERSWREVLDVFLPAGRGLAAAHAAGLVHRDFKPDNVLMGTRGEVKVTDFGIARAVDGVPVQRTERLPERGFNGSVITQITQAGKVVGTLRYMGPELFEGHPGDERSDEFSFCVALHEALYGIPPFGRTAGPAFEGGVVDPPRGTQVPGWVRKIVLRGLSKAPQDRYPKLAELLDALAADPAVKRRRALSVAGIAALVAAAVAGTSVVELRRRAAADPCHDPAAKLGGVWDDGVRSQVRAAFAATGAPDAVSAAYAEKAMDRVSGAWLAAYRDACVATRGRHAQSETALNLRLDCLDEQLLDLRAAGDLMTHLDPKDPSSAIGAALTLPLPSECADARALSVVEPPAQELRPRVEALRLRLARGRALAGAGRYGEAAEILTAVSDEAGAIGAQRLQVSALHALAISNHLLHQNQKAIEGAEGRAASLAEAAHLDRLATAAAATLAFDEVVAESPWAQVDAALARAREALRRVGSGGASEFELERAVGAADTYRGQDAEAAAHYRHALRLAEESFGSESEEAMGTANNLATALEPLGLYDEMESLTRKAIAVSDSILGPKSGLLPLLQLNHAQLLLDLGRLDEAEQALAALFVRMGPGDRVETAGGLAVQAALQSIRGRRAESLATLGRALEMATRLHLIESLALLDLPRYAAEAYLRDGRPAVALEEYVKYLAHQDLAADSAGWVVYLRLGGWAYLDAGQPEKALPILERTLKLSATHPFYPSWVARLRYQLAVALVETQGDRTRAAVLAQDAHDELVGVPVASDLLTEVDAWRGKTFGPR